jgi:DNA repair protein RadC
MKTFKELSPKERPREKLVNNGPDSLNNAELLAIVLGKGSKNKDVIILAHEIIELLENCQQEISHANLLSVKGIGSSRACQILAALEFSRRFLLRSRQVTVKSPKDAVPILAQLKYAGQEEFAVLTLDGGNRIIGIHYITRGLVNQNQIHPRETFYPAIKDRAVSIMLAHNHPSGNLTPSIADLQSTLRLVEVSKTMGISILDHLILSPQGYLSLREQYPGYFA